MGCNRLGCAALAAAMAFPASLASAPASAADEGILATQTFTVFNATKHDLTFYDYRAKPGTIEGPETGSPLKKYETTVFTATMKLSEIRTWKLRYVRTIDGQIVGYELDLQIDGVGRAKVKCSAASTSSAFDPSCTPAVLAEGDRIILDS